MNERVGKIDMGILGVSLALLGCGIVLVYSSSFALADYRYGGSDFFLARQVVRSVAALLCFMIFVNIDYHFWARCGGVGYVLGVALLVVVLVLPGTEAVKGAKRWITVGSMRFQISEAARMLLIIFLARKLARAGKDTGRWDTVAKTLVTIGILVALILMEPDFSTAMIVALVGLAMLFVAGARYAHLAMIVTLLVSVGCIGVLSAPYRLKRLVGFANFSEHKSDIGYQAYQAMIGLGNGGLFGKGLGQGEQKYFYLPEPHTDFAFSILGEETGFVGLVVVLGLFGFLIYRGVRVALRAPDMTGRLMAFGFTFALAIYVVLHASVNTGLVPTTGVPMPFLSYGGMNLVFTMCTVGILLNISSQVQPRIARREASPARGRASRPVKRGRGRRRRR